MRTTNIAYESESVVEALDYYPYGSTRIDQTTNNFKEQKQYIAQYSDPETNLSYLQARYYDGSKGAFLSEDPMFLGDPKQQVLTDPQSLNSYSYANDNPITKSDPTGKCGEDACVLEGSLAIAGAAAGFAGTYAGDVLQNRSDGKTGLAAYAFRSSPSQYAAAIGTGAVAAPLAAYSLTAAAVTSAAGYAYQNYLGGGPFSLSKTLAVGALSLLGGQFVQWGTAPLAGDLFPLGMQLRQVIVGTVFDMNSQVLLQNALNRYGGSQSTPTTPARQGGAAPANASNTSSSGRSSGTNGGGQVWGSLVGGFNPYLPH